MFRTRARAGDQESWSIWQPVYLGIDERGHTIRVGLAERNLLAAGEPGAGKSVGLNLIVAHAALSLDCRLILVDGKRVELGLWRACAEVFIGPSITDAIDVLKHLQALMDTRYDELLDTGRRKITRESSQPVVLVVFDELAYFSATIGETKQQKEFIVLVRDLVARGRAAGIIVVAATQRPSADIDPTARGVGWLIAEGTTPQRMKTAYLSDGHAARIAEHAARLRTRAAIADGTQDGEGATRARRQHFLPAQWRRSFGGPSGRTSTGGPSRSTGAGTAPDRSDSADASNTAPRPTAGRSRTPPTPNPTGCCWCDAGTGARRRARRARMNTPETCGSSCTPAPPVAARASQSPSGRIRWSSRR